MTALALTLIAASLIGIVFSWLSSNRRLMDSGVPREFAAEAAGTGIVPKWVSAVGLLSWLVLVAGAVLLLI